MSRLGPSALVRPRRDSDSEQSAPDVLSQASAEAESELEHDAEDDDEDTQTSGSGGEEEEDEQLTKDVSFGALMDAQAKLGSNPRKRRFSVDQDDTDKITAGQKQPREERSWDRKRPEHRSSKHAPTTMSTKIPVSRRRAIFSPPPAEKFRDPRFDASIVADARNGNTSYTASASKNYAFLNDYQAAEVLELKSQIKKTKSPEEQAQLKRHIMSIEAKLRNAEIKQREAEILTEHKKQERQAIREGKKARPYYLKQSDLKKQIEQERQDNMGKRAKEKSEKRKRKREKTKEARDMPRFRRIGAA